MRGETREERLKKTDEGGRGEQLRSATRSMEKYVQKEAGEGKRVKWAERQRERERETGQVRGGTQGGSTHTSCK